MWSIILLCAVALVVIYLTHYSIRWRNPKCSAGVLPPGSMGIPLIGETIQLIIPGRTLDLPPFIRNRLRLYGPIFKTGLLGRPIVVSADSEVNNFIYQQEGKLVELYYLDLISDVFNQGGESRITAGGAVHKYLRSITLNHFGSEKLREGLLSQIEIAVNRTLRLWSSFPSVEVHHGALTMVYNFNAEQLYGYDAEKSSANVSECFIALADGFMALPLNFPGTKHHKVLKSQKMLVDMFWSLLRERRSSPEQEKRNDFLDQAIADIGSEEFKSEQFVVNLVFGILFATGSIAGALTLMFKFLFENPSVIQELSAEHEAIVQRRNCSGSSITWDEYKSMNFTRHVINETLRLTNAMPFLLRRAVKEFQVKGYTIPAGWTIMVVNSALHLSPDIYKDPLAFNPWRWKEDDQLAKNLMPFGGGTRQCAGAEYTRVFMATFIHYLVTKYRWTKIKGGEISRTPMLKFVDGLHVKFSCKET